MNATLDRAYTIVAWLQLALIIAVLVVAGIEGSCVGILIGIALGLSWIGERL